MRIKKWNERGCAIQSLPTSQDRNFKLSKNILLKYSVLLSFEAHCFATKRLWEALMVRKFKENVERKLYFDMGISIIRKNVVVLFSNSRVVIKSQLAYWCRSYMHVFLFWMHNFLPYFPQKMNGFRKKRTQYLTISFPSNFKSTCYIVLENFI